MEPVIGFCYNTDCRPVSVARDRSSPVVNATRKGFRPTLQSAAQLENGARGRDFAVIDLLARYMLQIGIASGQCHLEGPG
jgi:hypothetical protein